MTLTSTAGRVSWAVRSTTRRSLTVALHGVDRIAHQVQHDLLQLDRIADDLQRPGGELDDETNVVAAGVGLDQYRQLVHHGIEVEQLLAGLAIAHQVAQPLDDLAGAQRLGADLAQRGHDFAAFPCPVAAPAARLPARRA